MLLKKVALWGWVAFVGLGLPAQVWSLELNGIAPYRELGSELFLGALYLENPANDPASVLDQQQAKRLEMRFVSSLSKRRWVNLWMQSIAINNSPSALASEANNLVELFALFQDGPQPGDVVKFDYQPGNGTSVYMNDNLMREKLSAAAFNLFASAWLGPVPPSTDFRSQILGTSLTASLTIRYTDIHPTPERSEAVAAWLKPKEASESKPETKPKNTETAKKSVKKPEQKQVADTHATEESAEPAQTEKPAAPAPQELAMISPEPRPGKTDTEGSADPAPDLQSEQIELAPEELSVASILANQEYSTNVIREVYKRIRYPNTAMRRNQQGSVRIRIAINRDGELNELILEEECEHSALNKEAKRAIEDAAPFPKLPKAVSGEAMSMTIPISFRLTE